MNIFIAYLAAVLGIIQKVWCAPNRMEALQNLTPAERFIVLLTVTIVMVCVKHAVAL